jgi:small-conductance mechanosensitive channel
MKYLLFILFTYSAFGQESESTTVVGGANTVESQNEADRKIEKDLLEVFQVIDALKEVTVRSENGVVTLAGKVPSSKAREEVVSLTSKTTGVIYVQDQIDEAVEVETRLRPAIQRAEEIGTGFLKKLPILAIALLSVVIFWFLGSWAGRQKRFFERLGMHELSSGLLRRFLKLVILGIGIFIALEILDATAIAAGVLGVAGVAGVALGFAFRNIVENYLAGILLSMRNPFSSGDAVKMGDHSGKVIRLTSRDTVLMTYDGNHLRIPNSVIITSALTNYSRNPLRRFDFAVGVSTNLNLVEVRRLGLETLGSLSSVLDDPGPNILIEELGDSTVNMRFFGWVDQRENDFAKSKSEAIRLVKVAFDDADIEMPEPIYRVHLQEAGAVAAKETEEPVTRIDFEEDLSVDDTIDKQVAAVRSAEDEDNLLSEEEG